MCDASNYAVGAVLAQRIGKLPHVIYYASQTLDVAQANYTTIEKELLAIVFALDKLRSYLLCYEDRSGAENLVVDQLSPIEKSPDPLPLDDTFFDE
ncbi:hypothetical protein L6164_026319 [Bauhinia variegata]|uniref:Uncharacterized protein n=1 Tax=Bauhinia variegata TaxID=167791 RepID=A0ACB9LQ16_BAUVA|nr:hypothetical protein L6164_026319 [Bauhinia variegata]